MPVPVHTDVHIYDIVNIDATTTVAQSEKLNSIGLLSFIQLFKVKLLDNR